jgi:hypothetical protein
MHQFPREKEKGTLPSLLHSSLANKMQRSKENFLVTKKNEVRTENISLTIVYKESLYNTLHTGVSEVKLVYPIAVNRPDHMSSSIRFAHLTMHR